MTSLFQSFNRRRASREIEDELTFHLDLLTDQLGREMSRDEARTCAEARFGDVDQIRDECLEISMRNRPLTRALKSGLILMVLIGVLVRVAGTDYHVTRMGDVLLMVGVLGRLLLYVRGLSPTRFFTKPDTSSQLILSPPRQLPTRGYDQHGRTPLERLILDK